MDFIANFLNGGYCYICDKKEEDVICQKCFSKLEKYDLDEKIEDIKINSFYKYNQIASKILLMSKYPPHNFYILKYLVRGSNLPKFTKKSILCPVPLSSQKMFERKFNQAEVIAKTVGKIIGLPVFDILIRAKDTKPLFNKNKVLREFEIRNAFKISLWARLIPNLNKYKVIIIDDLTTTGETLSECIRVLRKEGYQDVEILTLFRA